MNDLSISSRFRCVRILELFALALGIFCMACACTGAEKASMAVATITSDGPAYTGMPVWAYITFSTERENAQANMRYPFTQYPAYIGPRAFEVKRDGVALPQVWPGSMILSGAPDGSAAPTTSPKGRLPLHLLFDLSKPGTYLVRYSANNGLIKDRGTLTALSAWTKLEIKPSSPEQRAAWLDNLIAHAPEDGGLLVGDFLPSILACRDKRILTALQGYLSHPDSFVREYARESIVRYYGTP